MLGIACMSRGQRAELTSWKETRYKQSVRVRLLCEVHLQGQTDSNGICVDRTVGGESGHPQGPVGDLPTPVDIHRRRLRRALA